MIFTKHIAQIEETLGYTFKDKSLLKQAFTRASYCNENQNGKVKYTSNEVLEFFGDSVLSTAIVSLLLKGKTKKYEYGIFTELNEGDFSTIRSNLSDKKNLSATTKALGLEKYLLMSRGDEKLDIGKEPSVMEDLYESIIGAIYIDSGMDLSVVVSVVERTLDVSSYISEAEAPKKNAKNLLQEWCDDKKHRLPHPEYKVLSATGPDNKKTYECGVYIGEKLYARGTGKNQKLAEAEAAKLALEILKAEAKQPKVDAATVAQKLRELGSKNKVPSAEYRDLGETENSTINVKEYAIECRFMGKVATGTGLSKQDARAAAGLKILEEIAKEKVENAKKTLTKASKKAPKKAQNKATEARAEQKPADKNATKKAHQPKQKRKVFTKNG
jgi:ribonuclease-3